MRWIVGFVVGVVLICAAPLIAVRFAPGWMLSLVPESTGIRIQAAQVHSELLPFRLELRDFEVRAPGLVARGKEVDLSIDWWAWINNLHFWTLAASDLELEPQIPEERGIDERGIDEPVGESPGGLSVPPQALAFASIELRAIRFQDQTINLTLLNGERFSYQLDTLAPDIQLTSQGTFGLKVDDAIEVIRPEVSTQVNDAIPVGLSGGLVRYAQGTIEVLDVDVISGDNHATAQLQIVLAPLTVTGSLSAQRWLFQATAPQMVGASQAAPPPEPEADKLFSDEILPLGDWAGVTANVELTVAELVFEHLVATDVAADFVLEDEQFSMPLSATVAQGHIRQHAQLDTRGNPEFTLDLDARGMVFAELLDSDLLEGGELTVEIQLSAVGETAHEVTQSLNGQTSVMLRDARMASAYIDLIGSDLLSQVAGKLNPFRSTDAFTEVECALIDVAPEAGVIRLNDGLYLQTSKMNIVGSGKIDLGDEKLDITLTPSARQGVGINVGSLVKFIKVGGSLTNPRPALDSVGALQTGLAVGAAVSTVGVSLVAEGIAKQALNAGSPCERHLAATNDSSIGVDASDGLSSDALPSEGMESSNSVE